MTCITDQEARLIALINQFRAQHGLLALRPSAILMQAAQEHAEDMAAYDYLSHTGRDGSTHSSRAQALGYPTQVAGNILWGQPDADAAFIAWRDSPDHRANMLTAHYTEIGVALGIEPIWDYPGDHFQTASTEFGMGRTEPALMCDEMPTKPRPAPVAPSVPDEQPDRPRRPIVHLLPERAERKAQRRSGRLDNLASRIREEVYRRLGLR